MSEKAPEKTLGKDFSALGALKAQQQADTKTDPATEAEVEHLGESIPASGQIEAAAPSVSGKERKGKVLPGQELFAKRLLHSGATADGKETIFRNEKGAFVPRRELLPLLAATLQSEARYNNRTANHVCTFYVRPLIDKLQLLDRAIVAAKEDSFKVGVLSAERTALEEALVTRMQELAHEPDSFGIELVSQETPRHLLLAGNETYADDVLDLLQNKDIPDPFYVNGQLPMPKPLGDACKRIFERLYPDNDVDQNARLTRNLLKEKCVDQLVRELELAERKTTKTKQDHIEKRKAVTLAVARMTQFMREILTPEGVMRYVNAIDTGVMEPDLVQFPTITKRPSYSDMAVSSSLERGKNNYNFYKKLTANYTEAEKKKLIEAFERGDSSFFIDEAGTKDRTHVYFDVRFVLMQKGYTEEAIDTTFVPFIKEYIEAMGIIKTKLDEEYKKGFKRKAEAIEGYKQQLGSLRRRFVSEAKKQIEYASLLSQIGSQEDVDMVSLLQSDVENESVEDQDAIEFTCSDFTDRDTRIESQERFFKQLDAVLEPLRTAANNNELGKNDMFIQTREWYEDARKQLVMLVSTTEDPDQNAIMDIAKKIGELHLSLASYYEQSSSESDAVIEE